MPDLLNVYVCFFVVNVPCYILCCIPFLNQLRVSKKTLAGIALGIGILMSAAQALYIAFTPNWLESIGNFFAVYYILILTVYKLMFDAPVNQLLYIFLVVHTYITFMSQIALAVQLVAIDGTPLPFSDSYIMLMGAFLLLSVRTAYRVLKKLGKVLVNFDRKSSWLLCVIPVLFFAVNMSYMYFYNRNKYGIQDYIMSISILMTGCATYFLTFYLINTLSERERLRTERRSMEQQLTLQQQNYRQLTRNIEEVRTARHDLRHHLMVTAAYLQRDDKEGLAEYLKDYMMNLPDENEPSVCANYIVDVIVRHYLGMARNTGAELDIGICLPRDVEVSDSDLSILFGNLFENALNAVSRQQTGKKFIRSRCVVDDGKIILVIDNSMEQEDKEYMKEDDKCYAYSKSRKAEYKAVRTWGPDRYGVGQASVAAIAQKYGGVAKFEIKGATFNSSVYILQK